MSAPHLAALVGWQERAQGAVAGSFTPVLLGELAQTLETPYAWLLLESAEGSPELRAQYGFEPGVIREPLRWPDPMPERHTVVPLSGRASEPLAVLEARAGLMLRLPGRRGLCGLGAQEARAFSEDDRLLLGAAVGLLDALLARDESERAVRDVREQVARLEAELGATRLRLTQACENERVRLARELHDDVLQTLIGISYGLAETRRALKLSREDGNGALLEGQRQHVLELARRVRLLSSRLRPAGLEEFGLVASLQNLLTQLRRSEPGVRVYFADRDLPRLPIALELALYRFTQEALRQVSQGARGATLLLGLEVSGNEVCLSLEDKDDPAANAARPASPARAVQEHLGEMIGGLEPFGSRAEFAPAEEGGFRLRVSVPLPHLGNSPDSRWA